VTKIKPVTFICIVFIGVVLVGFPGASVYGEVLSDPPIFGTATPSSIVSGLQPVTPPAILPVLGKLPYKELEPIENPLLKREFSLSIKQQGSKITVTWKPVKALRYALLIKPGKGKKIKKFTDGCRISFKAKAGIKYHLQVRAFGEKNLVLGHSSKYNFAIPTRVRGLKVQFIDKSTASLRWKPCADQYMIYRKTCKTSGKSTFRLLKKSAKFSFTDKTVQFNKNYKYKVVPMNKRSIQTVGAFSIAAYNNSKIVSVEEQNYSYEEMRKDIRQLHNRYPDRVSYAVIGRTADNRKVYDVVLGNRSAEKSLLVVATLHAREYMCSLLCMNQIEYYLEEEEFQSVLDKIQIHYVVMANPDGVALSQFGIEAIQSEDLRSALSSMEVSELWKANGRGVDLNRNFPFEFQVIGEPGGAGYSGEKSTSENESKAILDLVKSLQSSTKLSGVINYHATGSIIFGDCMKKGALCKTTTLMYNTASALTGYIGATSDIPGIDDPYESAGNFREYVMYKCGVPSITIEIGLQPCPLDITEFPAIWEKNKLLVMEEAKLFL